MKKAPLAIAGGACNFRLKSTFAVLESFASARLAVFLALAHARVAGEQAVGFESRTQIGIGHEERPRDAVPDRASLAGGTTAADVDAHIEFGGRLGDGQRLQGLGAQVFDGEIILK